MPFEASVVFPGVLFDSAERYAKDCATSKPAPSIIQEMGWTATLIPETEGGYGGRAQDLGSIIEGLAAHAVSLPVVTRCGIVPAMLRVAPSGAAVDALRTALAEGEACIEFAGVLSARESGAMPKLQREGASSSLTGLLDTVELTDECSHVLFNAVDTANGEALVIQIEVDKLDAQPSTYTTVEGRSVQALTLDALPLSDANILARGADADRMQATGWQLGQAAIAADIVCTMNYALAETVRYLQERKQFGQALAQFQVLRHDTAKLYVSFESCKCLLMSSLRSLENGADPTEATAAFDLLGLYVREQAIDFAQSVIQLHGGMGMTQETLAARMAARLVALAFRYGDAYSHIKALGAFQGAVTQ